MFYRHCRLQAWLTLFSMKAWFIAVRVRVGVQAYREERKGLLVAIDRSRGKRITLYSVVISSVKAKD